jgi:hypothetical protein
MTTGVVRWCLILRSGCVGVVLYSMMMHNWKIVAIGSDDLSIAVSNVLLV